MKSARFLLCAGIVTIWVSPAAASVKCPPGQILVAGVCSRIPATVPMRSGLPGPPSVQELPETKTADEIHYEAKVSRPSPTPYLVEPTDKVSRTGGSIDLSSIGTPPSPIQSRPSHLIVVARAYLSANDIPPPGVGGYGVVAFKSLPTNADRDRLLNLCQAFLATMPRQIDLPHSVSISDQMLTIWPLRHPQASRAQADNCPYITQDYDLYAGQAAIADARNQKAAVDVAGPFLIAWSPTSSRGVPDRIVLVYDLSRYTSVDSFETVFNFWKDTIVSNPKLWRNGWTMGMRAAVFRDFLAGFAQQALAAIHIGADDDKAKEDQ